jgi:hypothetical protein
MDRVRPFFAVWEIVLSELIPQTSANSHRNRGAALSVLFPRYIAITSQLSMVAV